MLENFVIELKDIVSGNISFIDVQKVIINKDNIIVKTKYLKEDEIIDHEVNLFYNNSFVKNYNLDDYSKDSFSVVFKFYKQDN